MKLIVALCFVAVVAAAPPPKPAYSQDNVQLLRFYNDGYSDGKYSYGFEQTDGQKREETAEVKNAGLENEYLVVKGSYSWITPDGVEYIVIYVADDNGYQPEIQQGPGAPPPPFPTEPPVPAVPQHIASLVGG